jgi:hypothetical protein
MQYVHLAVEVRLVVWTLALSNGKGPSDYGGGWEKKT